MTCETDAEIKRNECALKYVPTEVVELLLKRHTGHLASKPGILSIHRANVSAQSKCRQLFFFSYRSVFLRLYFCTIIMAVPYYICPEFSKPLILTHPIFTFQISLSLSLHMSHLTKIYESMKKINK